MNTGRCIHLFHLLYVYTSDYYRYFCLHVIKLNRIDSDMEYLSRQGHVFITAFHYIPFI